MDGDDFTFSGILTRHYSRGAGYVTLEMTGIGDTDQSRAIILGQERISLVTSYETPAYWLKTSAKGIESISLYRSLGRHRSCILRYSLCTIIKVLGAMKEAVLHITCTEYR